MSSQLFFRDKGKIWRYNDDTKGAHSNKKYTSVKRSS